MSARQSQEDCSNTHTHTPLTHRHRYSKDNVAIRASSSGFIQGVGQTTSQVRNSCFLKHPKEFENYFNIFLSFFSSEFALIFSFSIMFICIGNVQRDKLQVTTFHDLRPISVHEDFLSPSALLSSYPLNIPSCKQVLLGGVLCSACNHPLYI